MEKLNSNEKKMLKELFGLSKFEGTIRKIVLNGHALLIYFDENKNQKRVTFNSLRGLFGWMITNKDYDLKELTKRENSGKKKN
jgi:hypothetical protein